MKYYSARGSRLVSTSAAGPLYRAVHEILFEVALSSATSFLGPATTSGYYTPHVEERTGPGPNAQVATLPEVPTAVAVLETRRRSGLTWEELSDLFDVSRRSVHHWASGKPASPKHEQMVHRVLAVLRRLDRGSQSHNRGRLLSVDPSSDLSIVELLRAGRFADALARADALISAEGQPLPTKQFTPLSKEAEQSRRPPSPAVLLGGSPAHPEIKATRPRRARVVGSRRNSGG